MARSTAAVAVFVLHASALAANPVPAPDHRWTLRGDFVINTPSHKLTPSGRSSLSLALEGTLSPGLPAVLLRGVLQRS